MAAPILVTGSHRSGTTWVGRMLCASGEAAYVHEPFNPNRSPGWFLEPLPYWFMHITRANEQDYVEAVRRMVELRYPTTAALARARSPRIVAMNAQQSATAWRDRRRGKRLLLKDPLALLSAEWLAERFGMHVIVLVRHPASFVSSIKRLKWGFDYERNWLAQPLLMKNLMTGYEEKLSGYRGEVDLVGEGIVIWRALYDVISQYRDRHPGWSIVRYEDLAAEPLTVFRTLYDSAGLSWNRSVESEITEFSRGGRAEDESAAGRHQIKRDSRAAARAWKTRLSEDEIERIRVGTDPVWRGFYTDDDWA